MRWEVEPSVRAYIVGFSGINFSGQRMEVELFPTGTRKGDLDGQRLKCIGVIAPLGVRVTVMTSGADEGWEARPWRSFQVMDGFTFEARDGKRVGVQIPDLDVLDSPQAIRTDPERRCSYPHADDLAGGTGWTYGRTGETLLKCNIRAIRVDRVGSSQ